MGTLPFSHQSISIRFDAHRRRERESGGERKKEKAEEEKRKREERERKKEVRNGGKEERGKGRRMKERGGGKGRVKEEERNSK